VCSEEDHKLEGLCRDKDFFVEGDLELEGTFTLQVKVSVKINWPVQNLAAIPVTLNISVSKLRGCIRLCFSNRTKSFLQFVRRPQVTVEVNPVLGSQDAFNLQSLPKVTSIITDVVNKEIGDLVYPKRLPMGVPCVSEPVKIDKKGNVITTK